MAEKSDEEKVIEDRAAAGEKDIKDSEERKRKSDETGQTDELLIFDEDAVQRDPPEGRQTRRRINRGAGFRCGVERNDDAFDLLCHEWA